MTTLTDISILTGDTLVEIVPPTLPPSGHSRLQTASDWDTPTDIIVKETAPKSPAMPVIEDIQEVLMRSWNQCGKPLDVGLPARMGTPDSSGLTTAGFGEDEAIARAYLELPMEAVKRRHSPTAKRDLTSESAADVLREASASSSSSAWANALNEVMHWGVAIGAGWLAMLLLSSALHPLSNVLRGLVLGAVLVMVSLFTQHSMTRKRQWAVGKTLPSKISISGAKTALATFLVLAAVVIIVSPKTTAVGLSQDSSWWMPPALQHSAIGHFHHTTSTELSWILSQTLQHDRTGLHTPRNR